ncbi:hypothetical protein ZIOFF_071652 [Zingiber officinale]|uniref:BHLH domain-containing protein n=1 Tax=Zingiber officinale TaxID=94328 RepID=A0A8J5C424_ZINOF|nr:hypothetical protein ZIOFF_071652 [Zingiber officinale]
MDFQGLGSSWSSFDAAMVGEESQVMAQLFGSQEMFWSDHSSHCDLFDWNQGSSSPSVLPHVDANYVGDNYFCKTNTSSEMVEPLPPLSQTMKRKLNNEDTTTMFEVSKKGKNSLCKRIEKSDGTVHEDLNSQNSSCYSSEDDDSNEQKGATNGKKRAGRGAATDPQSLYARKRRERINERLKTLQNLVPNGTKVDISTMLEEAVQYVKFLQLQIKLLSSDDLWMYAPIAYNGMNLGIDLNISQL